MGCREREKVTNLRALLAHWLQQFTSILTLILLHVHNSSLPCNHPATSTENGEENPEPPLALLCSSSSTKQRKQEQQTARHELLAAAAEGGTEHSPAGQDAGTQRSVKRSPFPSQPFCLLPPTALSLSFAHLHHAPVLQLLSVLLTTPLSSTQTSDTLEGSL